MPELEKSDVIKNVLNTLIAISGRKTTQGYAVLTMDTLIKQLETRFAFLKHVQIKDTRYSEEVDSVSVMSDINAVEPAEMGKAIYAIINNTNKSLGDKAGHFFIKEIQSTLGDDYTLLMREMGVDLGIMQLEHEVEELEKTTIQRK